MTPTPVASQKTTPAAVKDQPQLPPEEQFWVRYSPHHEFPLSSVATACFYVLLAIMIWAAARFLIPLLSSKGDLLDMEAVAVGGDGGMPGGGGGDGGDGGSGRPEDLGDPQKTAEQYKADVNLTELPRTAVPVDKTPTIDPADVDSVRYFTKGNISAESISNVGANASAMLMQQVNPKPGVGKGGTGTGGKGTGGVGKGGDGGDGSGKILSERQKRVLRWTMMFDTRTGDDYRVQLLALGAILGIPGEDGQYKIIRDLKARPAKLEDEDLKKINRIFWVDDRAPSIGPLAEALGIRVPNHVVAFFPEKLEGELLRKERAFANRKEHEILETRFRVVRRGNTYEPVVIDQRPAR